MKIPFKPALMDIRRQSVKWLIVHHTAEMYDLPNAMIDNPKFMGGSMDIAAAEKQTHFVRLCNTFHIPMVYFADQPGFMIGPESQLDQECITLRDKKEE